MADKPAYVITKKGRKEVGILPSLRTSFPEADVLRYLKKRKTPATSEEIHQGALKLYSKGYTMFTIASLRREGYVK